MFIVFGPCSQALNPKPNPNNPVLQILTTLAVLKPWTLAFAAGVRGPGHEEAWRRLKESFDDLILNRLGFGFRLEAACCAIPIFKSTVRRPSSRERGGGGDFVCPPAPQTPNAKPQALNPESQPPNRQVCIVIPRKLEHGFRTKQCWDPLYITLRA